MAKKPAWVIEKERAARMASAQTLWLFGLHAVRDALLNPRREVLRLVLTRNAAEKLEAAVAARAIAPEIADPRKFPAPLDPGSVHQGAAVEVRPLDWGDWRAVCAPAVADGPASTLLLLDRVTDPHNVGAMLRSAEVFGAQAVLAPQRHAAPETGALAKTASGALERMPYLMVKNLGDTMQALRDDLGYLLVGLDGTADRDIGAVAASEGRTHIALVLGAEGPGLRARTKDLCDIMAKVPFRRDFGSLNVSNAAAVALYALSQRSQ
jgi:23S rRNA (guanosine2251-2'-O)-methyltransferase